jgi:hypothetical protein
LKDTPAILLQAGKGNPRVSDWVSPCSIQGSFRSFASVLSRIVTSI